MPMVTFEPGAELRIPFTLPGMIPHPNPIAIVYPARVHMSPIDCNRFDFGRPGGGGYGFAVSVENRVEVSCSTNDSIDCHSSQWPLVKYFLYAMRAIFGYSGGLAIRVRVDDIMRQHAGLGSSAMLACGVVYAINCLFGEPLSRDECRTVVTRNFVEAVGSSVSRGLDTGVGTYLAYHGGFVLG